MRRIFYAVAVIAVSFILNMGTSFAYEKEIKSISATMSDKIFKAGKKTVAVVDFTDLQGNVTELGRFIAEEFSVSLADTDKGFEVIERNQLKTILKEHKLSTTGIIDPATAKKLGEIAGVDALITGTITPFGDNVRLSVKILDTSTAKVIGASSGEIAKTKAIEELLARGIETAASGDGESASRQAQVVKAGTQKEAEPFYQNDIVKITAKSLKKTGTTIKLVFLYENVTEKNIRIYISDVYLIDENGEKWNLKDVENIGRCCGGTDFPPKLPKMVKLAFNAKDGPGGTIFTAVLNHGMVHAFGDFQAVIRNIKAE